MSSCFSASPNARNVMSIDAAACVIDAVGTAPPRNAASAEPSAIGAESGELIDERKVVMFNLSRH